MRLIAQITDQHRTENIKYFKTKMICCWFCNGNYFQRMCTGSNDQFAGLQNNN